MRAWLWRVGLIGVLLGLVSCGTEGSSGDPGQVTSENHSWGDYHWARTANPFTLKLGQNFASDWAGYLGTASSDWSQSTVLDTTLVAGLTRPKPCRATLGRVEVCAARYGRTYWLGIAQIWITGSHIVQATVKLNDTYLFGSSTYSNDAWRQLVVCQEVGHTFGLDHQDENFGNTNLGTCMDYTSNPDGPPSNLHPNQHDYDQLVTIYTHLDSTTTVGAETVSKARPPKDALDAEDDAAPESWGKLMKRSANGRQEVYELDLGGGSKLRTFVLWAF